MSTMYTYTLEGLQQLANDIRETLSDVEGCEVLKERVLIVYRKGMLGRMWDKLFPGKEKGEILILLAEAKLPESLSEK